MTPKDTLIAGVAILDEVLRPAAFAFHFREEGVGSGGPFAWGEYLRQNRRLELHLRLTLGLVTYHVGDHGASHEAYMRGLGVWAQCRYPGFSEQPLHGFEGVAADLPKAEEFLFGDALVLRRVAAAESARAAAHGAELMAGYVGDTAALEKLRSHFRARRFREVISIFDTLKFPDRLSPADSQMVAFARRKDGG